MRPIIVFKRCLYCGKTLTNKKRKFCDVDCAKSKLEKIKL